MTIEFATELDVGARKHRQGGINEDSVAVNILEDGHLDHDRSAGVFVLADGAGGEAAGEIASYIATVEVARRLTATLWDARRLDTVTDAETTDDGGQLDEEALEEPFGIEDAERLLNRIETTIESTHTRILQTVADRGLENAYTTIVAGLKVGDRLYYGWVGDSRAYVVNDHPERADGERVSLLTRDHSVVERLRRTGEIDDVEALVHRRGHQITRALGGSCDDDPVESSVEVETNHVRLFANDTVLFASDGLVDAYADAPELHERYLRADDTADVEETILERSVTDDEVRDVILEAGSLELAASRFITLANQRGGKDNVSVILFRDGSLERAPADELPARAQDLEPKDVGDCETVIQDPETER